MKKLILLILITFSAISKIKALECESHKSELPAEIWSLIFEKLLNLKNKQIDTIPALKKSIQEIYESYSTISKIHNNIIKKVLKKYYLQRKKEIILEIREKLKINQYIGAWQSKESFDWLNNINDQDKLGRTALIFAMSRCKELVKLLIENGADLNIQDKQGWTALMLAAYYGYKELVELLIENGANVNLRNNWDSTLDIARISKMENRFRGASQSCMNKQKEIIKLLKNLQQQGNNNNNNIEANTATLSNATETLEKEFNDIYINGNYNRSHDCTIQ